MTKLISIAAILAATAGAASAYSSFSLNELQDSTSLLDLGTVVAENDGVVEVYDFHGAEKGRLLGMEDVHAGANTDVRVPLGATAANKVLAILMVDGQIMDQQVIDIDRN
jgi:hypothetical protein